MKFVSFKYLIWQYENMGRDTKQITTLEEHLTHYYGYEHTAEEVEESLDRLTKFVSVLLDVDKQQTQKQLAESNLAIAEFEYSKVLNASVTDMKDHNSSKFHTG